MFFIFLDERCLFVFFFFSSRRRHTRWTGDWSSDVCSSDLHVGGSAEHVSDHVNWPCDHEYRPFRSNLSARKVAPRFRKAICEIDLRLLLDRLDARCPAQQGLAREDMNIL